MAPRGRPVPHPRRSRCDERGVLAMVDHGARGVHRAVADRSLAHGRVGRVCRPAVAAGRRAAAGVRSARHHWRAVVARFVAREPPRHQAGFQARGDPVSVLSFSAFAARRMGARSLPRLLHAADDRSEEHTSELQSRQYLVCRLLLEKKKKKSSCTFNPKQKKKKNKTFYT